REAWSDLISIIRDEYGGRITRWDGAADDHEGIHSLEWALKEYESGGFYQSSLRSLRSPDLASARPFIWALGRKQFDTEQYA
ncbi:MAG: hypothetical protein RPT95_06510, partial [Candidatus Sedimenticola sp. (ex Thyasira tokunagai)]